MSQQQSIGIIDIGSNTVRLTVYQLLGSGAYRVIDQGKWTARLSQRMNEDGELQEHAIQELIDALRHYRSICQLNNVRQIRAVATAAIRQATNQLYIMDQVQTATGLNIEILSGEEEAALGSLAVLSALPLTDGFVIDIGGGSTEISLVQDRQIISSISFPIGCVNTATRFQIEGDAITTHTLAEMQRFVQDQLQAIDWIGAHPHLPLIGLGGTVRALAKFHQRESGYPLQQIHGYELTEGEIKDTLHMLAALPAAKRHKLPGLSKDRSDVIVSGLAILSAVYNHVQASRLVSCGVGLRDGLFRQISRPQASGDHADAVLDDSIRNLTLLYPAASEEHLLQVRRLALALFDRLMADEQYRVPASASASARKMLDTASRLFKIGAVIDFNNCADHTFYMLLNTHWNGLTHRELVLTAAIAAYINVSQIKRKLAPYRALLSEEDIDLAGKLGAILQLAKALDRSESQAIETLDPIIVGNKLLLMAQAEELLPVELMEVETITKEFKKNWGLTPKLTWRSPPTSIARYL